jgi:glucokinase-like ROK family protein
MRHARSSGPVALRHLNRGMVLDLLRMRRPISRTGLARKARLSKPTISVIVEELLSLNLVHEVGLGESRRGRRPVMLKFNPDARLVVGAELQGRRWALVLTNLDGEIMQRYSCTACSTEPDSVVGALVEGVQQVYEDVDTEQVLGVGIGVPGMVSIETGIVSLAINLGWNDVPLKELIEERVQLPVAVTNRCKAAALAEKWHGVGRDVDDLIYIRIGTGIGAGFVHGRELLLGSSYAGELGHCCVYPEGPLCVCGSRGCLETLASGPALAARARQRIWEGASSLLSEMCEGHTGMITGKMITEAAQRGDRVAREALSETGTWLGIAAGTLINLYNPQMIVFGGPVSDAGPFFIDALREEAQRRSLDLLYGGVRIEFSALRSDAGAVGAATMISRQLNALLDWSEVRSAGA